MTTQQCGIEADSIQLSIELGQRSYPITICNKTFDTRVLAHVLQKRKALIVTNETVAPLYLEQLTSALPSMDYSVCVLPDGEQYKNVQYWQMIIDQLAEQRINRSDVLIALGGGVVCDMTGFAAASWMRGVDVIQVPTTLLAQVDASVGGKTGINHAAGKNLIGAFHQPKAVIINTSTIDTLPSREFAAGMAESIKYGFINQPAFIEWIRQKQNLLASKDPNALTQMIAQCCQFKAEVVAADEKEQGMRALLNLGHTFGHAIETISGYNKYLHGEAVAIGMVMAAALSEHLKLAQVGLLEQMESILQAFDLPVRIPSEYQPSELVKLMRLDKKVVDRKHRLILMRGVGQAEIVEDVDETAIVEAIEKCVE
ncbi:3-dehydroquinate synthase [Marinicella sp. W31]|uniref:3-dehydroquinate synthase n=1 Tax=Marinicella sp. W31 TaxID=3023713 RepID=UPI0037575FF9